VSHFANTGPRSVQCLCRRFAGARQLHGSGAHFFSFGAPSPAHPRTEWLSLTTRKRFGVHRRLLSRTGLKSFPPTEKLRSCSFALLIVRGPGGGVFMYQTFTNCVDLRTAFDHDARSREQVAQHKELTKSAPPRNMSFACRACRKCRSIVPHACMNSKRRFAWRSTARHAGQSTRAFSASPACDDISVWRNFVQLLCCAFVLVIEQRDQMQFRKSTQFVNGLIHEHAGRCTGTN